VEAANDNFQKFWSHKQMGLDEVGVQARFFQAADFLCLMHL
jgi:hypothetical protein